MEKYFTSNELKINCLDRAIYYGKTPLMKYSKTIRHSLEDIDLNIYEIELECQSFDLCLFLLFMDTDRIPMTLENQIKLVKIADYLDMIEDFGSDFMMDSIYEALKVDYGISWDILDVFTQINCLSIYKLRDASKILERIYEMKRMQEIINKFMDKREIPKTIDDKKILLMMSGRYIGDKKLYPIDTQQIYIDFEKEGLYAWHFRKFAENNSLSVNSEADTLQILERIEEVREIKKTE